MEVLLKKDDDHKIVLPVLYIYEDTLRLKWWEERRKHSAKGKYARSLYRLIKGSL